MSELIEQARKDRVAAEAAGDLGLVVFIDGFIAGAIEMQNYRDWMDDLAVSIETGENIHFLETRGDNGTD